MKAIIFLCAAAGLLPALLLTSLWLCGGIRMGIEIGNKKLVVGLSDSWWPPALVWVGTILLFIGLAGLFNRRV